MSLEAIWGPVFMAEKTVNIKTLMLKCDSAANNSNNNGNKDKDVLVDSVQWIFRTSLRHICSSSSNVL